MANVQEGVSMLHQSNSDSPNSDPEYQCWPAQWVSNALQVSVHLLCNFDISDAKAWAGVEELKMKWLKNTGWGWRIGERVEIERWWSTRVKVSDASRQSRAEQAQNRRLRGPKGATPSERHKTRLKISFSLNVGQDWWLLSVEGSSSANQIRQIVSLHLVWNYPFSNTRLCVALMYLSTWKGQLTQPLQQDLVCGMGWQTHLDICGLH